MLKHLQIFILYMKIFEFVKKDKSFLNNLRMNKCDYHFKKECVNIGGPIIIYNHNNFYRPLIEMFDKCIEEIIHIIEIEKESSIDNYLVNFLMMKELL